MALGMFPPGPASELASTGNHNRDVIQWVVMHSPYLEHGARVRQNVLSWGAEEQWTNESGLVDHLWLFIVRACAPPLPVEGTLYLARARPLCLLFRIL